MIGVTIIQPRKAVLRFAESMEIRLRMNDHKSGWGRCQPRWLWKRMMAEGHEVLLELLRTKSEITTSRLLDSDCEVLIAECADVANFAMMIADKAKGQRDAQAIRESPDLYDGQQEEV